MNLTVKPIVQIKSGKVVVILAAIVLLFAGCSKNVLLIKRTYSGAFIPVAPDYSKKEHWASLPDKTDAADQTPVNSNLQDLQASAEADVFFVYPTIFTEKPKTLHEWNADVSDEELNKKIQNTTILNQASVFNGACRIYVPYYRQAHLSAFAPQFKEEGEKALDLAYQDVKAAFEYYLKHFNNGRPIVIASHSQGSYHAARLLKDYFDGRELQRQLVAAYLVGWAIQRDAFTYIQPTENPEEVGVWASWNTFERNYIPKEYELMLKGALSTNPLLWNSSEDFAPRELNRGGVALQFTFAPRLADAQNHNGILWINKPHFKGRNLIRNKCWHIADMNFFYMNIRENVSLRIEHYWMKNKLVAAGTN